MPLAPPWTLTDREWLDHIWIDMSRVELAAIIASPTSDNVRSHLGMELQAEALAQDKRLRPDVIVCK